MVRFLKNAIVFCLTASKTASKNEGRKAKTKVKKAKTKVKKQKTK